MEKRTHKNSRFGTVVSELERLRDWLKQEGVTHVVMESTASYWKPVFNVLEGHLQVYLANPEEVKNRKGHKTDDKDGWWLAHLLRHAMIHPSFIPPRPIRELRDLTRRRKRLLSNRDRGKESHPESIRGRQRQVGQRAVGCIRRQRTTDVRGIIERQG